MALRDFLYSNTGIACYECIYVRLVLSSRKVAEFIRIEGKLPGRG